MKKIALLVLAAPLVLAACGGGSSSQGLKVDPAAYVRQSAKLTAKASSEHMAMNGTISVMGQSVTLNGGGDFANRPPRGSLDFAISAAGHNISIDEVIDGPTGYVRSSLLGKTLPAGKTWMKLNLAQFEKAQGVSYSSVASQTPAQALQQLEAAGTVTEAGTATIQGDETTEFDIKNLDISKLPAGKLVQKYQPKYGSIDVWIGNANGRVYRETESFTYSVDGQTASGNIQIDFSHFGEAIHLAVPPASKTYDASSLLTAGLGA